MTGWLRDYIGLPFKPHGRDRGGVDCYGLYRLVIAEQCSLILPERLEGYHDIHDRQGIAAALIQAQKEPVWHQVMAPRLFDLVLLRLFGMPLHVGVYLGGGRMLHIEESICAAVERLGTPVWQRRLLGFWRPDGLPA